jgi:hypothetical protein
MILALKRWIAAIADAVKPVFRFVLTRSGMHRAINCLADRAEKTFVETMESRWGFL